MNLLWIIIAIVVVLLIIVGIVVVVGNNRKKSKTVSFEKNEEQPKELTQQEKSGNYQAKGGFSFAPANAPEKQPEPVQPRRVDKPIESVDPAEKEPEFELTHDAAEAVEELNDDEAPKVDEEQEQQDAPLFQDLAEEHAEDPDNDVDVEKRVEQFEATEAETLTPEKEAQEAADIAQVTAEVADQAREQTPAPEGEPAPAQEPLDDIEPVAGRIGRLRGRLSRSQNAIGQGLLGILTAGDLDEDAWEEIEDTLIMADLGADLTMRVTDQLREKIAERGVGSEDEARAMLRETLVEAGRPEMDRSIRAMPVDGKPAVILVVGVNGTGKTTTTGKLGRVLVSMGHRVLFGAADTFRAAAADQLETWGRRVGATTVRGKEGADPAAVAFDAVAKGVQEQADVVVIDTAGRLHTSTGLMDQLGKVKRVVEKKSQVDEVLLVLDATVGQNGLTQARIFRDVVDITGVVLTKLDGTAKGGIVFQVQEELGVPVKLVGLGEGADDLAPFEVEGFVDALLG
ncbi:signal recognition particle-docking protein FtsY [Corynebacterium cystitidis]|uniref:signal recognition particle-docking protein FtsY n=1 Tax=Corynebacterium cystitidis TaxID=35757 RepID=UPI00211F0665|nr:signal recognition particle-docking protein FtsY [Corynebacterium cystitidis]